MAFGNRTTATPATTAYLTSAATGTNNQRYATAPGQPVYRGPQNHPERLQATTWDQSLDAGVGDIDRQIKTLNGYQGTSQYDEKQAADLQAQRQALNVQRWRSAYLEGMPGRTRAVELLNNRQIAWDDLAGVDISILNDDARFASTLDDILRNKAAGSMTAGLPETPTSPNPVDTAAADAAASAAAVMPAVQSFIDSDASGLPGLKTHDEGTARGASDIASTGTRAMRGMGGEDASYGVNQSAMNHQANSSAQRDVLQKDSLAKVNAFIDQQVSGAVNRGMDLADMDTAKRMDLQKHSILAIQDELSKSMDLSKADAQGQLDQINAEINDWKAKLDRGVQDEAQTRRIIGLVAGVVMFATGAAVTGATAGAGAVPGGALMAGGAGMIAKNA